MSSGLVADARQHGRKNSMVIGPLTKDGPLAAHASGRVDDVMGTLRPPKKESR